MRLTCLLAVSLLCALCITQVTGHCNICGALSEDYCTCRGLRPNPKILVGSQTLLTSGHSTGACQCGKHPIAEPIITANPHAYLKGLPISVVYTTPLCSSCSAIGKPVCSNCVSNCRPLCNKCALFGKPSCNACVAMIGTPTVSAYSGSSDEQETETTNLMPQKYLSAPSNSEQAQQVSKSSTKFSFPSSGKSFFEVTETKLNSTAPKLLGLRKFFGYHSGQSNNNNNNNNEEETQSQSQGMSSGSDSTQSTSNNEMMKNIQMERNNQIDRNNENDDNIDTNSSDDKQPQAIYITYTGFEYLPDMTKIIAIPSLNEQHQQRNEMTSPISFTKTSSSPSSSSSEDDYQYKRGSSLLEFLKF